MAQHSPLVLALVSDNLKVTSRSRGLIYDPISLPLSVENYPFHALACKIWPRAASVFMGPEVRRLELSFS